MRVLLWSVLLCAQLLTSHCAGENPGESINSTRALHANICVSVCTAVTVLIIYRSQLKKKKVLPIKLLAVGLASRHMTLLKTFHAISTWRRKVIIMDSCRG